MAHRSSDKPVLRPQATLLQPKKRPSSCCKAERSKKAELVPARVKSASGPTKNQTDDLLAKEEQYKLLNAELEAKTANLVRQAEQLMREHDEALSRPLSFVQLADIEDEGELKIVKPQLPCAQEPEVKAVTRKKVTISQNTGKQEEKGPRTKTTKPVVSHGGDLAAVEESANGFLAETIRTMEEKMDGSTAPCNAADDVPHAGDNISSGVAEAQIRVLKAKLRIMQEELDQLTCEYYKKDDENAKLAAKIKEVEEDRARLQKTMSIQQTQIEKHRVLAEESGKKSDSLHLQVSALHKEIENLNRSQKQAAAVHGTVEVRLNRALEEVEKLKTQLSKMQQRNKDKISEDHQSKENLLAENRMLKKQKAELILGFKKQLKLIDVLKRQKMHLEAAKLLSFTEEEFVKALDWGKS